MSDFDLNFRPDDYFHNKESKELTIVSISFSEPMDLEENIEIEINVKKKGGKFVYSVSDNLDSRNEYKFSLKKNSQKTLTYHEVINMIHKEIKNPDGKSNIIYEEWDYQYYESENIYIQVNSTFYPYLREYFDELIEKYRTERELEIKENFKYDKIINNHINSSNIDEIISCLKQKRFGSFGIQSLNREVFDYVKNFYLEEGKLPLGEHKIGTNLVYFKNK